jgi:hypothetical protein
MKEKFIRGVNWVLGKNVNSIETKPIDLNNANIRLNQLKILLVIILLAGLIIGFTVLFIQNKAANRVAKITEEPILTQELADKTLDPEKHWRNYFEDRQNQVTKDLEKRLADFSLAQEEVINRTNQRIEQELAETKEKLDMAQRELASASLDLQNAARNEQILSPSDLHNESELVSQDFDMEVEFDKPKSAKNYIPEGTYFTGHLLGGLALSTGLNAPDEHATPISLKLMNRLDPQGRLTTNLSPLNKMHLQNCRIMGSAYGDLSSERAIIRLEKMICEQDGIYVTSKIAGQIFGSDGLNGIKGTIIATSSKHIKNAAIGGLISGIAGAAKGQDSSIIGTSGLIQTQKKGTKNLLGGSALQGASNAGDKIADYSKLS